MPIALTTGFDPGDFDPGNTYPKAKVHSFNVDVENQRISVVLQYGDDPGGVWASGAQARSKRHNIDGTNFTTLMAALTLNDESIYDAIKRLLYAQIQADLAEMAGTVE